MVDAEKILEAFADDEELDNSYKNKMLLFSIESIDEDFKNTLMQWLLEIKEDRAEEDRISVLQQLIDILVYMQRPLEYSEKVFFVDYFKELASFGDIRKKIGLGDRVWSRLLENAKIDALNVSEDAATIFNDEIISIVAQFEDEDGFYDETAAKYVTIYPQQALNMVDKCLKVGEKSENPSGLNLAMALAELHEEKAIDDILLMLAKKGCAMETIAFMHRLLQQYPEKAEKVANLLKDNLEVFKQRFFKVLTPSFKLYIARRYFYAIKFLAQHQHYQESEKLLHVVADNSWLDDNQLLREDFALLAKKITVEAEKKGEFISIPEILDIPLGDKEDDLALEDKYWKPGKSLDNVMDIKQWSEENPEPADEDKSDINNILNINSKDIDEHFEEMKKQIEGDETEDNTEASLVNKGWKGTRKFVSSFKKTFQYFKKS